MTITRSFVSFRFTSVFITGVLLSAFSAAAQVAPNVERSPDAIALIQRVLAASGGDALIGAIHDLVATGTMSSPGSSTDIEDTPVTISLRGLDQMRIDSTLPTGARSVFYNRGAVSSKEKDGTVAALGGKDEVTSISHFFPLEPLAAALQDNSYSVTALEIVADDKGGNNLYHFRLQQMRSETVGAARRNISSVPLDYYFDPTTNYVARVQNRNNPREVPQSNPGPFEIYRFSDYRVEQGILLPHQIAVSLDKRLLYTIRISNYRPNTGLAETDFSPTGKP